MAARLITCDLKNPSARNAYEGFYQVIRSYDHVRLSDTAFAVATDEYPKDIFLRLESFIDPADNLTVIALARFYMAHHDKDVLDWLERNV